MNTLSERLADDDDWGCEYCRNDGKLTPMGTCPKCDAQYDDEPVNAYRAGRLIVKDEAHD